MISYNLLAQRWKQKQGNLLQSRIQMLVFAATKYKSFETVKNLDEKIENLY